MKVSMRNRCSQSGMALIVSLVLLLSMTLLALAAIQNTSLEERMAGNVRAENIALQAAESALREAEAELGALSAVPTAGGALVSVAIPGAWWFDTTSDHWGDKGIPASSSLVYVLSAGEDSDALSLAGEDSDALSLDGDRAPLYVIEDQGYARSGLVVGQQQDTVNQGYRFRITARGLDAGGRGEVFLQSRYVRFF